MNLPTVERHYLTKEGDTADEICWRYYGFTDVSTEAVYRRNGFLAFMRPVLPGMLLIVLPVISTEEIGQGAAFWPTVERQLYVPETTETAVSAETNTEDPTAEGCCSNNAPVVEDAEYLAVYVQNEIGDWVLRRIHKSKLCVYGYGQYDGAMSLSVNESDPTVIL